jgi:hypothetical protein
LFEAVVDGPQAASDGGAEREEPGAQAERPRRSKIVKRETARREEKDGCDELGAIMIDLLGPICCHVSGSGSSNRKKLKRTASMRKGVFVGSYTISVKDERLF